MGDGRRFHLPKLSSTTGSKTMMKGVPALSATTQSKRVNSDEVHNHRVEVLPLSVPPVAVLDRPPPYSKHDEVGFTPSGRHVSVVSSAGSTTSSMRAVEYELDLPDIDHALGENSHLLGNLVKHRESVDIKLKQAVANEGRTDGARRLARLLTGYHQNLTTLIDKRHYVAQLAYQLRTRPQLRYHPEWRQHLAAVLSDMDTARIGFETIQYEAELYGMVWPEVRQREELLM